jgi:hypothetical protein
VLPVAAPSRIRLPAACLCAAIAVSACGADHRPSEKREDAGSEASVEDAADGGLGACEASSHETEPDPLPEVPLDAGVPLNLTSLAFAQANCEYFNRCSPMATYVMNECLAALSGPTYSWTVSNCMGRSGALDCTGLGVWSPTLASQTAALVAAVDAGQVTYDPQKELACIQAVNTQPCHGSSPWLAIAACASPFACIPDAGIEDAGLDAADGGVSCAALSAPQPTLAPCTTSNDCHGDGGLLSGNWCVDGYCVQSACGDFLPTSEGGCVSFLDAGQPCDSDPPLLGNGFGPETDRVCAPGLTCRGFSDEGLGVCAVPEEVGGPCVEGATISGCALGLGCECGECRIPPRSGPCLYGMCEVGISYCGLSSRQAYECFPVGALGADCTSPWVQCSPELRCSNATSTCESPML